MAGAKLVLIYPRPSDEAAFERVYRSEHMPLVEDKMKGMTRFVATKVLRSPQGSVLAYRLAEIHFTTMDDLTKCTESDGGKQVLEHANKISTGGAPLLLICEEESFVYW
ncbi:MAG: EthD family reductase [Acidobacteriaceae bacterium]|nr:EthD family reductase [Acidobacteriaceae bacterium]